MVTHSSADTIGLYDITADGFAAGGVAILKEDRGSHMKTLNKLRAERDAAAAQGDHAAAMKLNDHVLTLKSRSDDFCSEHGRDHMRMRPGNSFPFCQECEREESVVRRAVEAFWQELIEKDDRTSPADRPDMALITREELADFVGRAALALDPKGTS